MNNAILEAVYQTIVGQGVTPASKSLADVNTGIQTLSTTRYNSGKTDGYNSGYSQGKTDGVASVKTAKGDFTCVGGSVTIDTGLSNILLLVIYGTDSNLFVNACFLYHRDYGFYNKGTYGLQSVTGGKFDYGYNSSGSRKYYAIGT